MEKLTKEELDRMLHTKFTSEDYKAICKLAEADFVRRQMVYAHRIMYENPPEEYK